PDGYVIYLERTTTRIGRSVTSSLGRRTLGNPAASPARPPRRFWFSGCVGVTCTSRRRSSEHGLPQLLPANACPGYLSSRLMRSVRGVGVTGTLKISANAWAMDGFL